METAFGWIGKFMEWLASWFPHILVIKTTHRGVAWVRGKKIKELTPGVRFIWPIWTEYYIVPVVRQTLDLPEQTLTTKDGFAIHIGVVIVYDVADVVRMLTVQYDHDDTISDIGQVAVRKYTINRTFEELRIDDGAELKETVQKQMRRYGVAVREASVVDLAKTKVITMVGGGSYVEDEEEE
ncbi:MAG: hypothetical protein GY906_28405 [bacterium]|nr:hypothetical protein [bacterium]